MTQRLSQHYPTNANTSDLEALDSQRIYDLRIVQDNVSRIFDEIADKPHLDSFLLEGISIGTTETLVKHKLNRVVRGWYIVKKDTFSDIKDTIDSSTADLTKFLPLIAEAAVTVSIVVF